MADLKTTQTDVSVDDFLSTLDDDQKREDSTVLREMMERLAGEPAKMWGASIVGFGTYDYTYKSGHSGSWMLTGFAPRKANLSLYIMNGFDRYEEQLSRLGKHKTAKSCLYIKRLSDVDDMAVLEEIVSDSIIRMREAYA